MQRSYPIGVFLRPFAPISKSALVGQHSHSRTTGTLVSPIIRHSAKNKNQNLFAPNLSEEPGRGNPYELSPSTRYTHPNHSHRNHQPSPPTLATLHHPTLT